ITFLKNVLLREPAYRSALADVSTPLAEVGRPVLRFLRLENPAPQPAPADEGLMFTVGSVQDPQPNASWIGAIALDGTGNPVVVTAGSAGVHVPGAPRDVPCRAAGAANGGLAGDGVAAADLNYDF